ncbi:dTDP-4-dehydrorhamnose reductase [Shewanella psychrophila]|uniref:dTDP-4-dehydrorhamnose reductase n=1 Tax=Shewanella psychrophila TaxID=225848 RepID=A0A1S6HIN1_9GAMM|nr:dTDP-4-dehydrorhamnose reductase [Shewanella psychrophila]AQS35367.1 dTDP-4-dehydrorhamnose reductase [Shewanella psychrophila]
MKSISRALIIGKHGQLAQALIASKPRCIDATVMGRDDVDIGSVDSILASIELTRADLIINTAAYTQVDAAESQRGQAFLVNRDGAGNIALAAKQSQIRLIHLSTDYVFNGLQNKAYSVNDKPNAINVYGTSKLAGEQAVLAAKYEEASIVRSSWLYSPFGTNFVKTMLRLMGEKSELSIIDDQTSCPTSASELGQFIWALSQQENLAPIYHWSDAGKASWYQFALAIQDIALNLGKLDTRIPIKPISSKQFSSAASRPKFSLLDITNSQQIMIAKPWQENLSLALKQL